MDRSLPNTTRVTDEDRTAAASALGDAYARGALDGYEHEERLHHVWNARDIDELSALTADLPAPSARERELAKRKNDTREWLDEWRWLFGGAVITSGIWGVQAIRAGTDFFWPLVPLGIWAAVLVAIAIWPSHNQTKRQREDP